MFPILVLPIIVFPIVISVVVSWFISTIRSISHSNPEICFYYMIYLWTYYLCHSHSYNCSYSYDYISSVFSIFSSVFGTYTEGVIFPFLWYYFYCTFHSPFHKCNYCKLFLYCALGTNVYCTGGAGGMASSIGGWCTVSSCSIDGHLSAIIVSVFTDLV